MSDGSELSGGQTDQPSDAGSPSISRIDAVELTTTFSGPLPHPEVLAYYEQVHPGAAKQLFDDFLAESAHRRHLERRVVHAETLSDLVGVISASLIGLVGVAGGIWLLHEGRSLAGLSSVLATLGSLLSVYLYQHGKQAGDEESRN